MGSASDQTKKSQLDSSYYRRVKLLTYFGLPLLALLTLGLFKLNPSLADKLAIEDGPVEALSALALFVGFGLAAVYALRLLQRPALRFYGLVMLAIAGGLFLVGMEEISWGQRIFSIDSPLFFQTHNWQGELNLHNLDTGISEKVYYLGGFLLLSAASFHRQRLKGLLGNLRLAKLKAFVPSAWLALPFAVVAGFIAEPWLTAYLALAWALLIGLFSLAKGLRRKNKAKVIVSLVVLFVLVVGYRLFYHWLDYGSLVIRPWGAKEYKELFIALGLMVYVYDICYRKRGLYSQLAEDKTLGS